MDKNIILSEQFHQLDFKKELLLVTDDQLKSNIQVFLAQTKALLLERLELITNRKKGVKRVSFFEPPNQGKPEVAAKNKTHTL